MAGDVEQAILDLPATPAGHHVAWWLKRLLAGGEGASAADLERYTPQLAANGPTGGDEDHARHWRATAGRVGSLVGVDVEPISDFALDVELTAVKDRRWKLSLAVEPRPPHRIARIGLERLHDFRLEVREATPADSLVLADIERRCPIETGDSRTWFDRGEAWFDFARLMEDVTVGLAFVDGAPAAETCGARHTVRIGGAARTIVTVSHLRVLPEHQRKGLWGAANGVLGKYWPTVDGSNAFIAVANAGMQHGFRHTPDKWPTTLIWARLSTARLAGDPCGRPATPADAAAAAAALGAFHAGEEMFVPYTAASLSARLERAPDLYGWDNLRLARGALVGVWPCGRARRQVTERGGVQTISEPGVVLDYAYAPGAEQAFRALIGDWCARLAGQGMDSLTILTSPASPGANLIATLADETEHFNHWTPGIPPPPDAGERGLYIDPVYF